MASQEEPTKPTKATSIVAVHWGEILSAYKVLRLPTPVRRLLSSIWMIPAAVLIIVGAALILSAYQEYDQTLEQEYRFLEAHARIAEVEIGDALHTVDHLLQRVADDRLVTPPLTRVEMEARQRERIKQLPAVDLLVTIDSNGRIVSAASDENPALAETVRGFDGSKREYFTAHRDAPPMQADGYHITRPFKSGVGSTVFVISRAMRGKLGEFEGVAAATISTKYFDSVLSEIKPVGAGSAAMALNRQGDILYRLPDPEQFLGGTVTRGQPFNDFVRSGSHALRVQGFSTLTRGARVFLFRWVGDTDLGVAISRESDDVFAEWRRNLILRVLIFAFAVAVTLLLTGIASRRSKELVMANRRLKEDIAARERAEAAMRLYASVFQHSGEAILISDSENRILAVNEAFTRMTGYVGEEIEGQNPRVLASGKTPIETYDAMWVALNETGFWQGEIWDRRKDGEVYPKLMSVSAVHGPAGELSHYVASFIDISERKAAEERVKRLAHHDSLTGLLNRVSLREGLELALAAATTEQQALAVIFIDIDRFKSINDSLGHGAGDKLLVEVARRLRTCVRDSDIVARLGGDEFVVVLTGVLELTAAARVAQKIFQLLGQPYRDGEQDMDTTPSMGVAYFPADGTDVETLLKHADVAMYRAKAMGRNNVQFFSKSVSG